MFRHSATFSCLLIMLFESASSKDFSVTIFHTNDVHSRILSFNDKNRRCEQQDIDGDKCWGGVARRQTAIKKLSSQDKNILILDGGDQFQGTIWYVAFKWAPIAEYMNLMKYDAMVLGNHEFDDRVAGVEPFLRNLTFPVVVSNLIDKGSGLKGLYHRDFIKDIGGERIGFAGVVTADTPRLSRPGPLLEFRDEVQALQPVVDDLLKRGLNKIIVLSHAGITVEREICKRVKGVDIIVGGHTNTFLYNGEPPSTEKPSGRYPEVYSNAGSKNCLIVQDFFMGKYLGRLKVTFDGNGEVKSWSGNPILIRGKDFAEDTEMVDLLEKYLPILENITKTVVSSTAVALDGKPTSCRQGECNLGNVVADAAVYACVKQKLDQETIQVAQGKGAQGLNSSTSWSTAAVAIWNGGGIRQQLETPPNINLTLEDMYTILPFGHTIDKISITGATLKEALEHGISNTSRESSLGRFPQVSGLKVVFDISQPNGNRVKSVLVRCNYCAIPKYEPLDLNKTYDVVTNSYVLEGGDAYTIKDKLISSAGWGMGDVEMLIDYVNTFEPLTTGQEMRIEVVEESAASRARWVWGYFICMVLVLMIIL